MIPMGSFFDSDDVRLNLAIHGGGTETPCEGGGGRVRCFFKSRLVACFDFAAKRCSVAVRKCRHTSGLCSAPRCDCGYPWWFCESAVGEIFPDRSLIVVTMGCPDKETWRIFRKNHFERGRYAVGEFVLRDAVPDVENKETSRLEHPAYLGERLGFVRKEHGAKLAHGGIEFAVGEGKRHGVCLLPPNRTYGPHRCRFVQHGLIQIRCDDGNVFQGCQGPRHYASACGDFQDPGHTHRTQPLPQILRVRLEYQRNEICLIQSWDGTGEYLVNVGHRCLRRAISKPGQVPCSTGEPTGPCRNSRAPTSASICLTCH